MGSEKRSPANLSGSQISGGSWPLRGITQRLKSFENGWAFLVLTIPFSVSFLSTFSVSPISEQLGISSRAWTRADNKREMKYLKNEDKDK